jgi:hypothetical protein
MGNHISLPKTGEQWRSTGFVLLSMLLPVVLYGVVLWAGVPQVLGTWALLATPTLLVTVSLLLALIYALPGRVGTLVAWSATLLLFALPLAGFWEGGISFRYVFGGLLPFRDAAGYYYDAQRLLEGNVFPYDLTRRPFFTGTLATLLWLNGQNLQIALAIFVLINAAACFLLAREVQRSHGPLAGAIVLTLLFVFYRDYAGAVMTEHLGVALGALALALLWRSAGLQQFRLALLGILVLTIALNARAGAFFVLPALVLWGGWVFRGTARLSLSFLALSMTAIVLGFGFNAISSRITVPNNVSSFSNFSHTLYGLAVGGQGWAQVRVDHPEIRTIEEPEKSQLIYQWAMEEIRANPSRLLQGMVSAVSDYFSVSGYKGLFSFMRAEEQLQSIIRGGLYLLSLIGLLRCLRYWKDPQHMLLMFGLLGILASVPLVPPGDAPGMRAYAATLPINILLVALGVVQVVKVLPEQIRTRVLPVQDTAGSSTALIVASVGLVTLVFVGPIVTKFMSSVPQLTEQVCPADVQSIYVRLNPGSSVTLAEAEDATHFATLAVPPDLFRRSVESWGRAHGERDFTRELTDLERRTSLFSVIDLYSGKRTIVAIAHDMVPRIGSIVHVCVEPSPTGDSAYILTATSVQPGVER